MANRSWVKQAQEAFKNKDVELAKALHTKSQDLHDTGRGRLLKSGVYGGLDGIITTFAVVAGVAGAGLELGVVLILGFANLIADGLSMAIGDYLSTKSEQEYNQLERERETWELHNLRESEILEMEAHYETRGMSAEDAKLVVNTLAKYETIFIDTMMAEELGIIEDGESPIRNALVTFFSFLIFGLVPLLAPILSFISPTLGHNSFYVSIALTGITLFVLGAAKSIVSGSNFIRSGLEMLTVGGLAATAAYLIGHFLGGFAG